MVRAVVFGRVEFVRVAVVDFWGSLLLVTLLLGRADVGRVIVVGFS